VIWLAAYSRYSLAAFALSAAVFALGIAAWDARKPWPRFIERASAGANPFRDALPSDAVLFWPGPYGKSWLALGKPTWISVDQGAGVVFNRATAIEYAGRVRDSAALQSALDNCAMVQQSDCRISAHSARELCARPGGPSHLVLNGQIEGHRAAAQWPLRPAIRSGPPTLYLYACRDLARRSGE
jgi:hypothetical protein